jgi:AcrR family transcriptional regulator
MGRWEPNARDRLARSALELFLERGFENATAAEIAERAGLAKSTFFRHFADKAEVLFGGQDALNRLLADAILSAPAAATPIEALGAALDAAATVFGLERRTWVRQRRAIIAGNSDLRERETLKAAALTAVMADALRQRGVRDPAASLAAQLGGLAFRNTHARWVEPVEQDAQDEQEAQGFAEIGRRELAGLAAAISSLG